ncbi:MAG TPA: hypothetical protein VI306_24820 [Pyrinomonadaceae bacterium]
MFPHGAPGIALLLLRISVATVLVINAATNGYGPASSRLLLAIALLSSVSLTIGLLTPYLSVLATAFAVASLLTGPHARDYFYVFPVFDALILAVLGPGAYSLDARLFGRRVTVMPPRKDPHR